MSNFAEVILKQMNTQLERIEICLNKLSEEEVWRKVKSNTNSIGNLCIHLAGNEYQHFVSGIGGKHFIRERSGEFNLVNTLTKDELLQRLRAVREESEAILLRLSDHDLSTEIKVIYDEEDWRRMRDSDDASEPFYIRPVQVHMFQVAEHYGYHTGQIVLLTKLLLEDEGYITPYRH